KQFAFRRNIQLAFYQEKLLENYESPDVLFNINQSSTVTEETKKGYEGNQLITKTFEPGTNFVKVIVNNAKTRNILKYFIDALRMILEYYQSNEKFSKLNTDQLYDQILPGLDIEKEE